VSYVCVGAGGGFYTDEFGLPLLLEKSISPASVLHVGGLHDLSEQRHGEHKHQEHSFIAQSGTGRLGCCFNSVFFSRLEIICPYDSLINGWIKP